MFLLFANAVKKVKCPACRNKYYFRIDCNAKHLISITPLCTKLHKFIILTCSTASKTRKVRNSSMRHDQGKTILGRLAQW
jgi:hypothetical protein